MKIKHVSVETLELSESDIVKAIVHLYGDKWKGADMSILNYKRTFEAIRLTKTVKMKHIS